ncbi:MAG: GDSL-type esterase/lipase family protein [Ignavibacteriaceae bacterium]
MQNFLYLISLSINLFFIFLVAKIIFNKGGISYLIDKLRLNSKPGLKVINPELPTPYYKQRQSLFEILPIDYNGIIFIGDSIIDGCEWSELLQNSNIKNRGIISDSTEGILNRIEKTLEAKPKKIFIMIGVNDLSSGSPLDLIIGNYERIVDKIKAHSPLTGIYIHSVLPTNDIYYKGNATNDKIKTLNERLQIVANKYRLTYIDVFSKFLDNNGRLDERYSNDGVHLLGKGYLVWKTTIEKYIN